MGVEWLVSDGEGYREGRAVLRGGDWVGGGVVRELRNSEGWLRVRGLVRVGG